MPLLYENNSIFRQVYNSKACKFNVNKLDWFIDIYEPSISCENDNLVTWSSFLLFVDKNRAIKFY